jgi:hypothetical protein
MQSAADICQCREDSGIHPWVDVQRRNWWPILRVGGRTGCGLAAVWPPQYSCSTAALLGFEPTICRSREVAIFAGDFIDQKPRCNPYLFADTILVRSIVSAAGLFFDRSSLGSTESGRSETGTAGESAAGRSVVDSAAGVHAAAEGRATVGRHAGAARSIGTMEGQSGAGCCEGSQGVQRGGHSDL